MAKGFAWSFSKLKEIETCPKRHYEMAVAKNYKDGGDNEALLWGNQVHEAIAKACLGQAPLPASMLDYQKWVNTVRTRPGELKVEQKYAITRDFLPTPWFANNVWYRGIADVALIDGTAALAIDWKTGKVPRENPHTQLMLMAQCLFSHFPQLQVVRTAYVWLADDSLTDHEYTKKDVMADWIDLLARVERMKLAYDKQDFPPKPGGLCRSYCPVTSCPYHGKGVAR